MAQTQTFTFGPGALELLELRVWTGRTGGTVAGRRQLKAELRGTYHAAVEIGYEAIAIREGTVAWEGEATEEAALLQAARGGEEEAAYKLAGQLLEWALEGWVPETVEEAEPV